MDEAQIATALDSLKDASLVRESSGGRVTRYEHNFQRGVGVFEQSAVLLGLLMLRGPQTAGELRLNADRWYKFADISSVDGFLDELQERSEEKGGPLVVKLARAPGACQFHHHTFFRALLQLLQKTVNGRNVGKFVPTVGIQAQLTRLRAAQHQQAQRHGALFEHTDTALEVDASATAFSHQTDSSSGCPARWHRRAPSLVHGCFRCDRALTSSG